MKTWLLTQEDIIGLDQEKKKRLETVENNNTVNNSNQTKTFADDIPKHAFFRDNKAWHFMWIVCLSIFVFWNKNKSLECWLLLLWFEWVTCMHLSLLDWLQSLVTKYFSYNLFINPLK